MIPNRYRCETCKKPHGHIDTVHGFKAFVCGDVEFDPVTEFFTSYRGCASHSDFQSEQDVKELFRKEIAKWKDEDPLFMAYVHGEWAGRTTERDRVLDELVKKMDARSDEHHIFVNIMEGEGKKNTELWRIQHQRLYALDEVYEWIEGLRQAGEQE
jgi:hypothetical protein